MTTHIPPITEDDIAQFLTHTPGFFERHAEGLASVQKSSTLRACVEGSRTKGEGQHDRLELEIEQWMRE